MKYEPVSGIRPTVMLWARQSMGLSIPEVANRLKRPVEEIEAWETGQASPSYPQLEKLAYLIYKRPLAVFFLPEPPTEAIPASEFRTLAQVDMQALAADTYLQIRRAHAFQLALKELFNGRNPGERCVWQNVSLSQQHSVIEQAATIRNYLGVGIEEQTGWKNDDSALKQWRKAVEDVGVFIFKAPFKQKDISGFCLRDKDFPIIYLNNSTTKTRQIFSLIHELAHLLSNMNGLSKFDQTYIERLPADGKRIERFCNAITAEVLIPIADFQQQAKLFPENVERASEQHFSDLAARYGVSREAVLRRFLDQNRVSVTFYEQKASTWAAQQKQGRGGDWYASQNVYLSDRFAKEVVSRHYRHQLSVEQAADFLGINPKNFAGLEQRILEGAAA